MVDLIAKTPAAGLLPITKGACTLTEVELGPVISVMPFEGQWDAVDAALQARYGLGFPAPGTRTAAGDVTALWSGAGQAFLIDAAPADGLNGLAAMTDQSDAWCCVELQGPDAEAVLARLVPVDLRPAVFAETHVLRTLCQHMSVILWRRPTGIRVMAFRSMAATLVHEIADAMAGVAARAKAG